MKDTPLKTLRDASEALSLYIAAADSKAEQFEKEAKKLRETASRLTAEKAELDKAIFSVGLPLTEPKEKKNKRRTATRRRKTFDGKPTKIRQILDHFQAHPEDAFTIRQMADQIGISRSTATTSLQRLCARKELRRTANGYQLAQNQS